MSDLADQHYTQGEQLMALASADIERAAGEVYALQRAQTLAAVVQGHFHAAMAATTMGTQRELMVLARGEQAKVGEADSVGEAAR